MTSAKAAASKRQRSAILALIAFVILVLLNGCGGAWQPDRPDLRQPSGEGRGVYGPSTEDSRIQL